MTDVTFQKEKISNSCNNIINSECSRCPSIVLTRSEVWPDKPKFFGSYQVPLDNPSGDSKKAKKATLESRLNNSSPISSGKVFANVDLESKMSKIGQVLLELWRKCRQKTTLNIPASWAHIVVFNSKNCPWKSIKRSVVRVIRTTTSSYIAWAFYYLFFQFSSNQRILSIFKMWWNGSHGANGLNIFCILCILAYVTCESQGIWLKRDFEIENLEYERLLWDFPENIEDTFSDDIIVKIKKKLIRKIDVFMI